MSLNYVSLKESKNELIHSLLFYFEHIVNLSSNTYNYLVKYKEITNDFLEEINIAEEKSDILYDDVLKSAIWIIQKNQPFASSLRFVISCINSAKELERSSDYLLLVVEFLKKRELDKTLINDFLAAFKKCVDILNRTYVLFKNEKPQDSRIEVKTMLNEFEEFIKQQTRMMFKKIQKQQQTDDTFKTQIDLINALNGLERIVTHVYNVIKSFSYIDIQ